MSIVNMYKCNIYIYIDHFFYIKMVYNNPLLFIKGTGYGFFVYM